MSLKPFPTLAVGQKYRYLAKPPIGKWETCDQNLRSLGLLFESFWPIAIYQKPKDKPPPSSGFPPWPMGKTTRRLRAPWQSFWRAVENTLRRGEGDTKTWDKPWKLLQSWIIAYENPPIKASIWWKQIEALRKEFLVIASVEQKSDKDNLLRCHFQDSNFYVSESDVSSDFSPRQQPRALQTWGRPAVFFFCVSNVGDRFFVARWRSYVLRTPRAFFLAMGYGSNARVPKTS